MSGRVICQAGHIGREVNVADGKYGRGSCATTGYTRCRRTAVWRFSSGCPHEHLTTWLVCTGCAQALLQRWSEEHDQARCIACRLGAEGHTCRVAVTAEALERAA